MIDAQAFTALRGQHPALAALSDKVSEILRDELSPDEGIRGSWPMRVGKVPGALVLTERRLVAAYTTRLFVFFNFPTIQEFDLSQVRQCEPREAGLYLRATPTADPQDEDYEENLFGLESAARDELASALAPMCPALT